ncbi:HlyD family type I secretion periplasmic adaptor subunit [Geothermobacter hydrogeniphilus]|uniref:HlyD family type I secretion periplasmic adaptor subunit n=1 Tax=Geothermobacter hydrogeniphilus TaxID=1969733 RepID=A0A2K2H704_9BACT|nr:HlyD family type I secretion periplasmic adaptor subunit [Geothermobacter hydrogeniphilus]PNU19086.1 HlyD family type I secretion periplasmic adaptor subunit [Geothermobacter hydrogeniphilus]
MFRTRNDHHQFKPLLVEIEEEPLNPLGRLIFWTILAALLLSVLWMFFGRVDVVVSARGKVIPAGEVKEVQPLTSGVVRAILVKPGQRVEAGEVLMEIDPTETEPELASMKADRKRVALELKRLDALLTGTDFTPSQNLYDDEIVEVQRKLYLSAKETLAKQVQVKQEELAQIEQQLAAAQQSLEQADYLLRVGRDRLDRITPVRDLLSRDEYDRALTDVAAYNSRQITARHKVEELEASRGQVQEQIRLIEEENRNRLLTEMARKRQESLYLTSKIERTEFVNSRQQIRAPVRGYVAQLFVHTIGGVVTPAEKLATLVPADSRPVIKSRILNRDVGYVHPGMEVAIKVDTFDFQKYGMLNGRLLQVARDSVDDDRLGLVYEAYVEPLETSLLVDGVPTSLTTGMSVTTEIKVGKRRIIEFFIYPLIKYWDEGTSVR